MTGLEMKYFVLKPKGNTPYSAASRAAMRRYSKVIRSHNPVLADELLRWAEDEFAEAYCNDREAEELAKIEGDRDL